MKPAFFCTINFLLGSEMQSTFVNTECCFWLLQEQRCELQIARNFLLNKEHHYIGLKTDLGSTTYPSLSHACVRAFQQQFCFLLSQVSQCLSETHKNLSLGVCFLSSNLFRFVVAQKVKRKQCSRCLINALNISWLDGECDTCDSKNAKTPVVCAYTRARGGDGIGWKSVKSTLHREGRKMSFQPTGCFSQNDRLLFENDGSCY